MKKLLLSMFCALGLLSANAAVTQSFVKDLGFPEAKANMPAEATEYTASDTNIKYTLKAAYTTSGYLMINGKENDGAFISFSLDFPCSSIELETTSGCSTNANNKVNFYVNDNLVKSDIAVNAQNAKVVVEIPANYQTAGSVYKIQYDKPASGSSYNSQFASFTYYGVGETPEIPETPEVPTDVISVAEALSIINSGSIPADKVQVKGIISAIDEISAQYGNATFDIKDALTDTDALNIFRCKWLENANFAGGEIAVGGTIVVEGKLVLYSGKPQMTTGGVVLSYTPGGDIENPNPGEGGNQPGDEEGTVTYDIANSGYSNAQDLTIVTINDVTFSFDAGSNQNGPKYYTTGNAARLYGGNSLTVSVPAGSLITKVVFTFGSGDGTNAITAEPGTFDTDTWTGSSDEVTFTIGGTSGHRRISKIVVTYESGEAPAVVRPAIACDNNMVTIECETPGAKIYYTTDGTNPTNASKAYTAPFAITETVTVKAIAYVGTDASAVSTFVATYVGTYADFASYIEANPTDGATVSGPITAIYQNGMNTYLKDSKGGYMLSYAGGSYQLPALNNGDVLASISGKYSPYAGLPEMIPTDAGNVTTGGAAVQPEEITLEEVSKDGVNAYVIIKNVNISAPNGTDGAASRTYAIEDGTNEQGVVLYNTFYNESKYEVVDIPMGEGFTITGFICINNDKLQITPIEITGGNVMEQVENPVFNPAGGAIAAGTKVEITCATEGAVIYYTTDGTEPTIASNEYKEPIVVNDAMTISAIAVMENMISSDIVSASYTIVDPNATVAEFNFNDEAWLTGQGVTLPTEASTGTDVAGKSFTVNAITTSFAENTNNNVARIWRNTDNQGGGVQLRMYTTDGMTISAANGFYIHSIVITSDAAANANLALAEGEEGEITAEGAVQTWMPTGPTCPTSVSFAVSKTTRVLGISVVYNTESTNGVSDITADDNNAPVEYYNLQGVRVDNPAAGQLIIRKQGKTVTKLIVR